MKVAVVGVTGMVGQVMLKVLEERNFPVTELIPAASQRSIGKEIEFRGEKFKVISVEDAINKKPDIALFSAGGKASLKYAPVFAEAGCYVVDNSSAWRMHDDKKLIVPEINAEVLKKGDLIIANPNCSTIQMVLAMAPLHKKYTIKRVVVSTYQSVTGTGVNAYTQLVNEEKGVEGEYAYPHQIYRNCLPHCADFEHNEYTTEENKLVNETHKILDPSIKVTATCVRVPVVGGHSEAVNIEFAKDFKVSDVKSLLNRTYGITVLDNVAESLYPMPIDAEGKDDVFVGRIRRDHSNEKSLNLWIVSDNLRKGAATNTVQIAEYLLENFFN